VAAAKPGARQVVHHVLAFVIYPLNRLKEQPKLDGLNGYVGIYVPGEGPTTYAEGMGKYVPAGATLAFQIHYTTNGKACADRVAEALRTCRAEGRPFIDLTASNPTRAGFSYPPDLLAPLADVFAEWFLEFLPKATYPVRAGDVVEITIDGLGTLRNPVKHE
jgi:hypothetical protein